jgi:hypothetical protein
MDRRIPLVLGVSVVVLVAATQAMAQTPAGAKPARGAWTAARTPDGQPDLQGIWANNSITPLERPVAFKDRATMTDAELAELKKRAADLYSGKQAGDIIGDRLVQEILKDPALRPFDPDTGNYNSFWIVDRDWDNRTSLITDPPDGRIPPLSAEAQQSRRSGPRAGGYSNPASHEDLPLNVRCISYGVPNMLAGYNSYFQIVQGPGYVVIQQEMIHDVRLIPLDGRPHVGKNVRLWNGDSRGRWEGDTLVVETTNYSPRGAIRGASQNLQLVERFRRAAADTIEYSLTFTDPAVWTKPWTAMIRLKRSPDKIYEYACHEGNEAMTGILSGARARDGVAAEAR